MIRHAMGAVLGLALAAWMVATPAWPADAPGPETNGVVVLETDFGLKDGAVSAMRGVAVSVDPTLRLEDLTHEIPTFDIWKAVTIGQQTPPVASVLITGAAPHLLDRQGRCLGRDSSERPVHRRAVRGADGW
jgi:hypothetical protein